MTHQKPHQCDQTNHHYQANAGDPTLRRFSRNSDSSIAACHWSHVVADYENLRPIPVGYRLFAASARKCPQLMHHPVSSMPHTTCVSVRCYLKISHRTGGATSCVGSSSAAIFLLVIVSYLKNSGLTTRTNDRSLILGNYHYFTEAVLAEDMPAAQCVLQAKHFHTPMSCGLASVFHC